MSGKWMKSLLSSIKPTKTATGGKEKKLSQERSKKWSLWKSSEEDRSLETVGSVEAGHTLAVTASPAVVTTTAPATVVCFVNANPSNLVYKSVREEWASLVIQTTFRGFLARRAFRALKGLVQLQALVRGHIVRKRAAATFRSMQAVLQVQLWVRAYRLHNSREGQTIPQKIKQRFKVESQLREYEEGWCDSIGTMEDIQAREQQRQAAAIKRARALAYAFSNQWRASSRSDVEDFEVDKAIWGWNWLEQWMASQPLENPSAMSETHSMKSHGDAIGRKKANMPQGLKVRKPLSCRVSLDVSKDSPKSFMRDASHEKFQVTDILDLLSDENLSSFTKCIQKVNGELAISPMKAAERRAFSNPKQRPRSVDVQAQRRHPSPSPDVRYAVTQKLQSVPRVANPNGASHGWK